MGVLLIEFENQYNTLMKKSTFYLITLGISVLLIYSTLINPLIFTNLRWVLVSLFGLCGVWLVHRFDQNKRVVTLHKVFLVLALMLSGINFWVSEQVDSVLNPVEQERTLIHVYVLKENAHFTLNPSLVLGVSHDIDDRVLESVRHHVFNEYDFHLSFNTQAYDGELIDALFASAIEAVMLDSASLALLEEEALQTFVDNTIIIYTFEKSISVIPREPIFDELRTNAIVFYISGIDTVGDLNTRSRSDVNQLAVVNPDTRTITLFSIPRDTFVPTTCLNNRSDKLAHAAVRGIECSITTLENYLNVPINYYVRLNFSSFINIFDLVGPVEVYSHYNFSAGGYTFVRGMNLMDTEQALTFARARKQVPGGDQTRGLHQQEIIMGVFNHVLRHNQISGIQTLINQTSQFVHTDITPRTITALLDLHLGSSRGWTLESHVLVGRLGWAPMPNNPSRQFSIVYHTPQQLESYRQLIKESRMIP